MASVLAGCAARNPDGTKERDSNCNEHVSAGRTVGLIVAGALGFVYWHGDDPKDTVENCLKRKAAGLPINSSPSTNNKGVVNATTSQPSVFN